MSATDSLLIYNIYIYIYICVCVCVCVCVSVYVCVYVCLFTIKVAVINYTQIIKSTVRSFNETARLQMIIYAKYMIH